MAKYRVNEKFKDIHTGEIYKKDKVIDMTVKRATEVAKNLGDDRLTRLDAPKNKE